MKLAVLIASHNRKDKTISCLDSLKGNKTREKIDIEIFLVDASSSDGTRRFVETRFPEVRIQTAPPNYFWARSMYLGWKTARKIKPDFVMWLNDDVQLFPNSIDELLQLTKESTIPRVIVGSTIDPDSGRESYGGWKRGPWHSRLSFQRVETNGTLQPIELGNGNIVFYPANSNSKELSFPRGFEHNLADFYFTFSCLKAGTALTLSPRPLGYCKGNSETSLWEEPEAGLLSRLEDLFSPRGLPFAPWARYSLVLGGVRGPLYALQPLLKVLLTWSFSKFRSLRGGVKIGK